MVLEKKRVGEYGQNDKLFNIKLYHLNYFRIPTATILLLYILKLNDGRQQSVSSNMILILAIALHTTPYNNIEQTISIYQWVEAP